MYHTPPRRRYSSSRRTPVPTIAFLLVASFGILFAGCGAQESSPEPATEEFAFTEDDVARFRSLIRDVNEEYGDEKPYILSESEVPVDLADVQIDVSKAESFKAIRRSSLTVEDNLYRVTNTFLNVRSSPNVTASIVEQLDKGDTVTLIKFHNAAWAHVRLPGDREGYVSLRYIAKMIPEHQLAEERSSYEGKYFVDFGFLNVRKEPDTRSEKVGELPGQTIIEPLSMDDVWARIVFEGQEGYIAQQYLSPFAPNLLVRQDQYSLPILHYRLRDGALLETLPEHIASLQDAGYTFLTLRSYYDLLVEQEERDARLDPKSVVIAISGITPENYLGLQSALSSRKVPVTLFFATHTIGPNDITENDVAKLARQGYDIQSGGHTGDDLRSLTSAQLALELTQSQQILEQASKEDVFAIAYPIGGVNERVMELTAEHGYLFGVSLSQGVQFTRGDFLQLPSIAMEPGTSVKSLLTPESGE